MVRRILALLLLTLLTGCAAPMDAAPPADTPLPAAKAASPAPTASPTPAATPTPSPAPVPVTLYLPDASGKTMRCVEATIASDTPMALLDALVYHEALPDVDYGRNLYFTVGDSFVKVKNKTRVPRVVARLDVADAFLRALESMTKEREQMTLQCMANTFIVHYGAEVFMPTVAGDKLETPTRDYEKGIAFDQYVKTHVE